MRRNRVGMGMVLAGLIIIVWTLIPSQPITVYKTVYQTTPQGIAPQVAQVRGAVVHVAKEDSCQGSGCLISPDGILFTARHVSDNEPAKYTVTLDDGKQYPVKYVLEDRENDVSFMQLILPPGVCTPYVPLAKEDNLRVGDAIFIFGSPLGKENMNTVSLGILSAKERDLVQRGWPEAQQYNWHVMLQSTSPAFPGNSGGPVFNMQGEVIGVLVAGEAETLNFSVPISRVRDTIETVRNWFALCRFRVVSPDMRGPAGPQGEPGLQGPVGPQGPPATPEPNEGE